MIIRAAITLLLLYSCQPKQDDDVSESLASSLNRSSRSIGTSTLLTLEVLNSRTMEPEYQQRAEIWEPKAQEIKKHSEDLLLSLDSLTRDLEKSKGKNSTVFASRMSRLFQHLADYRSSITNLDAQFQDIIDVEGNTFKDAGSSSEFQSLYFEGSEVRKLAGLAKLKNQIRIIENRLVNFCYDQTGMLDGHGMYTTYSAIIGLDVSVVSPGKEIELIAGIGSFTRTALPFVFLDGKQLPLAEDGATRYTFNAQRKPGKYSHKVDIKFIDQEGVKQEISKRLDYTVVAPCN